VEGRKDIHDVYTIYILQYAKTTCQAETMPNSEKIKLIASEFVELSLSEDISQSGEMSIKYKTKFCSNF